MSTPISGARIPNPKSTPSRSILRQTHSTLPTLKRPRSGSDLSKPDEPAAVSSPTKRRKVEFSDAPNEVHSIGKRTLMEFKLEVQRSLEQHSRGDSEGYLVLKEYFANDRLYADSDNDNALKPHELRGYVIALASFTPVLKQNAYESLVTAILRCTWVGRDESFINAFIDFLAALITVKGSYMIEVLDMIVSKFSDVRRSSWSVPGFPKIDCATMHGRLHIALQRLLRMFPGAQGALRSIIKSCFPSVDETKRAYSTYLQNILRIKEYAPALGPYVLDLIVKQMVDIDVEMQADLDDLDGPMAVALQGVFSEPRDEEDLDDDSDAESVASDDSDVDEDIAKARAVRDQVEKLDTAMETMFLFYDEILSISDVKTAEQITNDYMKTLLSEFSGIILQTRKSRHTQFLLFHFVQQSENTMMQFIDTCEAIAFRSNSPAALKDYAVCYLASFVARAGRLPDEVIRGAFHRLLSQLERLRLAYQPTCRSPDLRRYYSYYAVCQAVLYVWCFRWQSLIEAVPDFVDPEDPSSYVGQALDWGHELRSVMQNNLFGPLNPLKVCAPGIVEEFAKLAHKLNLAYVYPLLETNKRIHLGQYMQRSYSAGGGALRDTKAETIGDESMLQLEQYFPFDPYQLPQSKRWIEGEYLSWRTIPGINGDDSDDDSSEDDDDDDVLIEEEDETDSDEDDK
ncbi:RNA polymerase I-specific transcription initiation factor rrn3 [Ceratocystis lukuohia]|uniref:RNA polymerase I-specific transcription initiation factor rrn3 n=2 Tax=Ceratocystis TaxID=5157 RepID=A0A0F8B1K3_CERFI|nr:RNA polymerase I-specific transcription initiation factor rrn3 [Ceratocystis platani]